MISPPVDLIFFCYKVYQEKFKTLKVVQFFEGFDSSTVTKQQLKGKTVLLILDNLMMTIKPENSFHPGTISYRLGHGQHLEM